MVTGPVRAVPKLVRERPVSELSAAFRVAEAALRPLRPRDGLDG
jgi:hypothetical protein